MKNFILLGALLLSLTLGCLEIDSFVMIPCESCSESLLEGSECIPICEDNIREKNLNEEGKTYRLKEVIKLLKQPTSDDNKTKIYCQCTYT